MEIIFNFLFTINLTLTTGNYTASVHTVSDYYNKAGNTEAIIVVNDDRFTSALTASDKTVYLKTITSGYKYSVTLKDANGAALANKTVTIAFNGKTYTATTTDKGVATVTLKSTATGSKKATVKFAGDDEYKATTKTATIKITKEASKLTAATKKTYKVSLKSKKYTVTLKSKSNKAISGAKVTIKVNGKTYTATTKSNGQATFNINKLTKKGTFKSTVKFAGNKYYNAVSKTVTIVAK